MKHYRIEKGLEKQKVSVSTSNMSSFAIKEGQKMTLNIAMGDGKRLGQGGGYDGGKPRTGGGLKALKKPLAPLAKPPGSQPGSGGMMGFGMGGGGAP